jgi:hypothetical protein
VTSAFRAGPLCVGGAPAGGAQRFRYVLDHRLARSGSARLTYHELAPGHHRLEVLLAAGSSASHASTTFTVRGPRPAAVVIPAEAPNTTPVPVQTTRTTSTTPPPTKNTTPPPPLSGGILQGGGGDGDSDNSGGPSDGDGNV